MPYVETMEIIQAKQKQMAKICNNITQLIKNRQNLLETNKLITIVFCVYKMADNLELRPNIC